MKFVTLTHSGTSPVFPSWSNKFHKTMLLFYGPVRIDSVPREISREEIPVHKFSLKSEFSRPRGISRQLHRCFAAEGTYNATT